MSDVPSRFDEFWKQYPKREAKAKAQEIWARKKLDRQADAIIANVAARVADPRQWTNPQFIPLPTSYLNQRRWEDEWQRASGSVESLVDRNARRATEILGRLPREENADAINAESMRRLGMKP
ncbi:hypothetical protein [Lysobacter sp. FW306-1B-D06B]|uniref:hypothetical protein n=1 Tax=Lysobacter sp. FW306-1B-D06B TaxID=3140250 RepID=UPI00313FE2CE